MVVGGTVVAGERVGTASLWPTCVCVCARACVCVCVACVFCVCDFFVDGCVRKPIVGKRKSVLLRSTLYRGRELGGGTGVVQVILVRPLLTQHRRVSVCPADFPLLRD